MLGESHCLERVTVHLNVTDGAPHDLDNVNATSIIDRLSRFRGLQYFTIADWPRAQMYMDHELSTRAARMGHQWWACGPAERRGASVPEPPFIPFIKDRMDERVYMGSWTGDGYVYDIDALVRESRM